MNDSEIETTARMVFSVFNTELYQSSINFRKENYLGESSNKHFHEIFFGFYLKMVKKEIESKYLKGGGKLDFFNCIQHQMPSLIYGL